MIFGKKHTDRTKQYWQKVANSRDEVVMEKICQGFTSKDFETERQSIIFEANIPLSKEIVILDLACGMGRLARFVAPNVKKYIGIDFIPEMINKARTYNKQFSNVEFYVNEGADLSVLDSQSIDIVFCELAFQHMVKTIQESYIKEVHRVLKKNGLFYLQIPRLEFYKDPTYARSEEEILLMFKGFDIENLPYRYNKNYALVKAIPKNDFVL